MSMIGLHVLLEMAGVVLESIANRDGDSDDGDNGHGDHILRE